MTTILIDGDVLLYKATIISEMEFDWGDDVVTIHSDLGEVRTIIDGIINSLCEAFETDEVRIALSSRRNFRKTIDETYKAGRGDKRKPVGFAIAREWMAMEYKCTEVDGLEADDVLGVWATQKSLKGQCVIATIDKDLRQIPGTYHNLDSKETVEISEADGFKFHMYQTLVGDPVDGFPGCPGIGAKRAEKILDVAPEEMWGVIVKAYVRAGLTERDALKQARLAKILQLKDINPKTKEPILWTPPRTVTGATKTSSCPAAPAPSQRTATGRVSSKPSSPVITSTSPATTRNGRSSPSRSSSRTTSRSA